MIKYKPASRRAKPSDHYLTPNQIEECIEQDTGISKKLWHDPCIACKYWHADTHYNGLIADCPIDRLTVCNIPFSDSAEFILHFARQFARGCNIVLILLCESTDGSQFAKAICHHLGQTKRIGRVAFKGCYDRLRQGIAIVYLLHDDVDRRTLLNRATYANRWEIDNTEIQGEKRQFVKNMHGFGYNIATLEAITQMNHTKIKNIIKD